MQIKNILLGLCALLFLFPLASDAQPVSILQYRHIPQENVGEFLERETEYWQKVAQKAVDEGKMSFWALFEKVGVYDAENTSNYLFINTAEDLEMEGVWSPESVFPKVPINQMETMSLGKVTSQLYVENLAWVDAEGAIPEQDYNYLVMNYFDPENTNDWLAMERDHFMPFITEAMKDDSTSQNAWGHARILAPLGGGINATTISMDLFPTLRDALLPQMAESLEFPMDEVNAQWETLKTPHHRVIYRIVAVVSNE